MPTIDGFLPPHRVVALVCGAVAPLDLGVVAEVFGIDRGVASTWYDFAVCGPRSGRVETRGGLALRVPHGLDALETADTVIVLPVARYTDTPCPAPVANALKAAHARGARVVSICLGSFILASAGLLDGRRATTHWRHCDRLATRFPDVEVLAEVLYIDDGDVLTSGGVAAGIDLCLHLVRKDFGADVANVLAKRLVVAPHREGGQAQFIEYPVLDRPGPLTPLLEWIRQNLEQNLSIDVLAARAHLSPRTFCRQFQRFVGVSPHQWITSQRVTSARRLLEATDLTVEQIAHRVGLGHASVLRTHFAARIGVSPAGYRRTFATTSNDPAEHAPRLPTQRVRASRSVV